ncbi:MAG: rRNA methyltransferase [Pseudopedobacter saltans]|uniref:Ribosomal RNA small subunit methyltransferase E n=1 Tax=Pseudopedobacter saltans TaxID=151895 RepID=A0A2W5H327_9SPHI|nr:MAG: rRNA methyltransferase [Pseudopedobacter saltans]
MQLPYFFEPLLQADDTFYTLSESTSKHCVQVLRMQMGSQLLLTNGNGLLATVTLTAPHKTKAQVKLDTIQQQERSTRKTCIGIGLLKNNTRLDWFLEKATELGITEIIPMMTEHTEKNHFRQDRATAVLAAAMIQSQQSFIPTLHEPIPYHRVIEESTYQQKLIAHCEQTPKTELSQINIQNEVQLLIGPEGDFSTNEISLAEQKGFSPVGLGTNRLRTETAGITGAVLLTLKNNNI